MVARCGREGKEEIRKCRSKLWSICSDVSEFGRKRQHWEESKELRKGVLGRGVRGWRGGKVGRERKRERVPPRFSPLFRLFSFLSFL